MGLIYDGAPFEDRDSTRRVVVLADGSTLIFVKTSPTQVTAFHSIDRITFTEEFTINFSSANFSAFSVAIEDGDHLQCVYQTTGTHTDIYWQRFTRTGDNWIAQAVELVMSNSSRTVGALDIDVIGTTGSLVIWRELNGSNNQRIIVRGRSNTGTWGAEVQVVNSTSINVNSSKETVFVSRDVAGASGNFHRAYFGGIYNSLSGAIGAYHGTARWDVTSGEIEAGSLSVLTGFPEHIMNNGNPGAFHRMISFPKSAGVWYGVSFSNFVNNTCTVKPWIATLSGSTIVVTYPTQFSMPASSHDLIKPTAVLLNNDKIACFTRGLTNGGVICVVADVIQNTVSPAFVFSLPLLGVPLIPYAGAQKNVTNLVDVIMGYSADGRTYYDSNYTPGVPTNIRPANSEVVNTDLPTLQATLPTPVRNIPRKAKWFIASDSAFSANLQTIVQPDSALDEFAVHTDTLDSSEQLNQQLTWFIRAQTVDAFGQSSANSSTASFTVSHPPLASNLVPDNTTGAYGSATVFDWDFTDTSPVDAQSAFQIIVENSATGANISDTGKVVSTSTTHSLVIPVEGKDIQLRWKIRLWDSDDVVGEYTSYKLFRVSDIPTVDITSPTANQQLNTPTPTFVWTYTSPGGNAQTGYRVIVRDTTIQANIIYDSGIVAGTLNQLVMPSGLLLNGSSYTVAVTVFDTLGLSGSQTRTFSVVWDQPLQPAFTASGASYAAAGYNTIAWDNLNQDAQFAAYRVYRRIVGDTIWNKVYEITQTSSNYSYQDWFANSETPYEYVVVQAANRSGAPVESQYANAQEVLSSTADYYLIHPTDATKNIRLSHVTSEDFTEEWESEVLPLIGRGRKVDYGTRWGYAGTLVCQVWDEPGRSARAMRAQIESLKRERTSVFLRNPFGDTFLVDIQNLQFDRMPGVGVREFHTLTIPYLELDGATGSQIPIPDELTGYPAY